MLAFWKGNMTSVVHRFPYSGINFYAFEVRVGCHMLRSMCVRTAMR